MHFLASFLALVIALVNPAIQPIHLWDMHRQVLTLRVAAIDEAAHTMTLELVTTHKGPAGPATVTVRISGEEAGVSAVTITPGHLMVALVGEARRGGNIGRVSFYTGTRQPWQLAQVAADGGWDWAGRIPDTNDMTQGFGPYWGTWNGHVEQLDRMMHDLAEGKLYFPVAPVPHFAPEQVLASGPAGAVRGLALRDLDGDGRLVLIIAGSDKIRILKQDSVGAFVDAAAGRGLDGVTASSVSAADADGDGNDDLLLDGNLWSRRGAAFVTDPRLPPAPAVLVAAFVDWDGDGWPDVLRSLTGGGLQLWRNPAKADAPFTDVTAASGLDLTANLTGYVAPGDWDGDGRLDLFYAAKKGFLLVQNAEHRFARVPFTMPNQMSFKVDDVEAATGASMFAPLWSASAFDVLVTTDARFTAMTRIGGIIDDATTSGNEFAEGGSSLFLGLVEDLNADGCLDVLGCSGTEKQGNIVIANRNYGSYMRLEKYHQNVLPGRLGAIGVRGAVAADLDHDGATDLIVASADGSVGLYHNASLADLALVAPEDAKLSMAASYGVRVIDLDLAPGRSNAGAIVRICDADGHDLARRFAGAELLSGCRGPDRWSIALRASGTVTATVRFSDGVERSQPVTLPVDQRTTRITLNR